jgi:hypothetical protein
MGREVVALDVRPGVTVTAVLEIASGEAKSPTGFFLKEEPRRDELDAS